MSLPPLPLSPAHQRCIIWSPLSATILLKNPEWARYFYRVFIISERRESGESLLEKIRRGREMTHVVSLQGPHNSGDGRSEDEIHAGDQGRPDRGSGKVHLLCQQLFGQKVQGLQPHRRRYFFGIQAMPYSLCMFLVQTIKSNLEPRETFAKVRGKGQRRPECIWSGMPQESPPLTRASLPSSCTS